MFTLNGHIDDTVDNQTIEWIASAPANRIHSFAGSGLPFHSKAQAFHNTPNKGVALLDINNKFTVKLQHPNSFYEKLGTDLIPPTLYMFYTSQGQKKTTSMQISNSIPYRMLNYPKTQTKARTDAMFYDNLYSLPVRTQEQILIDSAYPSVDAMAENFWGLKPAV